LADFVAAFCLYSLKQDKEQKGFKKEVKWHHHKESEKCSSKASAKRDNTLGLYDKTFYGCNCSRVVIS
jgi:hypothetical protein